MFGGARKKVASIAEAEGLVETDQSRGPRHWVATTQRDGVEVTVEIRPQQLYRDGQPIDRSPQQVIRRHGVEPSVDVSVLAHPGHSTRPEASRGPVVSTGDEPFDNRFAVRAVDPADVERLLQERTRSALMELDDVAELRIDHGQVSLHLATTRLEHEPIRAGIKLVTSLG